MRDFSRYWPERCFQWLRIASNVTEGHWQCRLLIKHTTSWRSMVTMSLSFSRVTYIARYYRKSQPFSIVKYVIDTKHNTSHIADDIHHYHIVDVTLCLFSRHLLASYSCWIAEQRAMTCPIYGPGLSESISSECRNRSSCFTGVLA